MVNNLSEYKLFVQRVGLVGISNILVSFSGLILVILLTKNFSIQDYGMWVQVGTVTVLVPLLATLGLDHAMSRYLASVEKKEKIQEAFYSITGLVTVVSLIICFILFLFSKTIAVTLFNGNVTIAVILPLIAFFGCLNLINFSFFRAFQKMKLYSLSSLLLPYLTVVMIVYVVKTGLGIVEAVMGLFIIQLILFTATSALIIWDIGFKIPRFSDTREYLSFGIPLIPSNLSSWMVDQSDRLIIGIMWGTAFVGYYSPGYTLGSTIFMLAVPFGIILTPLLSSYYDKNKLEQVKTVLRYSLKYFLLMAIPSFFFLSLLSKPILLILTTPEIAQNGYIITPFVALSLLLFGIYGIVGHIFIINKKTNFIGKIWVIAAILNIVLNLIFIPQFGIIAAAVTTLIAYTFTFTLTWFYSTKYLDFEFEFRSIVKSIIASILMSISIIIINPQGILSLLIVILTSSLIYITILLILKGITREEIQFFKELL